MNRKEWRGKALSRLAWNADIDADTLLEMNDRLNDALKKVAGDCPQAVVPDVESVLLLADKTGTALERTASATTDKWVLTLGPTATGGAIVVNGTWDGRFHIEVTDPTGGLHRRQCREFWKETVIGGDGVERYYVSLDRPWRNTTDTEMVFRLHQPEFFFRDDVMEVLDGAIWGETRTRLVELPEDFMRHYQEQDFRGNANSRPQYLVRGRHFQMESPVTKIKVVQSGEQNPWVGPYPIGTWRFAYTYVWGRKDDEYLAPGGSFDPLWESAPSPLSDALTISNGAAGRAELSGIPNIDFMQDFDPSAGLRKGRTGWRKRIYVWTDAVDIAGAFVDEVEALSVGLFLAEVEGNVATYSWDGSVIPDYKRRLPESQGYYAHKMVPHQDAIYEIDFRVRRRPGKLATEYDAPPLHPDSEEALVVLAASMLSEMDKQFEKAAYYRGLYENTELPKLQRRWGSSAKMILAAPWLPGAQRARVDVPRGTFKMS